ncbi:hypothetical protein BYT27DRAFT_6651276 [Phlegmacium glaucopus]|nr:hypothetical protein BYT27DRAFT_6651276 [Phlegmacium glaucopus]
MIGHCTNILARPLLPLSDNSFYPRETTPTGFTDRSEWSIIWSCLATLFACSWVAIHPNIPAPADRHWRIFGRRLSIMLYTLLAPEIVIIWAGRQYFAADDIAQRNKDRGWTRTHAFFALMGGFMLYEDGAISRTLSPEELERLFTDGRIIWPKISQREIEDRSKGDFLSKGFAVLQTTWFIFQCIVRVWYQLALSHLEVVTVAFATLNGVVYYLWWNKPVGIACPIPVHLLPPLTDVPSLSSKRETGIQTGDEFHSKSVDDNKSPIPSPEPAPIIFLAKSETESTDVVDPQCVTKPERESSTSELHSLIPSPPSSTLARIWSYVWGKFLSMGPFAILYILIFLPAKIIWSNLHDMLECDKVDNSHGTQSVPTFYAPESPQGGSSIFIALRNSICFGGIHCIAWSSSTFPSIEEDLLWGISSIILLGFPVLLLVLVATSDLIVGTLFKDPRYIPRYLSIGLFGFPMLLAYTVARAVLLILPLLLLRSLPSSSLLDVYWFVFIPHI